MSPDWTAWCQRHATVFALNTDPDAAMLAEWVRAFTLAGWLPAELEEATRWIMLHDPPRYRTEHLDRLSKRVRECRAEAGRAAPPEAIVGRLGECTLCRGAGLVPVPNPRSLARGQWTTQAVGCTCALGGWFTQHGGHLRLSEYERQVPDWRRLLEEHEALGRRFTAAKEMARSLDRSLGQVLERLGLREMPADWQPTEED